MENLKTLYNVRDEIFSDKTYEIFKKIDNTLACLTLYLTDIDEAVAQGVIAWEDTSLIDDLVVVIGTVQYDMGDIITIAGVEIEVTPNNVLEIERVIHMSIPYDLVIEDDKDNIMEFLYTVEAANEFNIDGAPANDFDLSELSDEQRKSLQSATGSNRNN